MRNSYKSFAVLMALALVCIQLWLAIGAFIIPVSAGITVCWSIAYTLFAEALILTVQRILSRQQ